MRLPRFLRNLVRKSFDFIRADGVIDNATVHRALSYYARQVGDGLDSNVIAAPVMWLMRAFTEAEAVVQRSTNGVWKRAEDHPAEALIARPNGFYSGNALWKATIVSYVLDGNAYWRKVRNAFGDVLELWYVPHWLMRPKWPQDGSQFISHYEYAHGYGQPTKLAPRDVVHFRFGLDPRDNRIGMSPLRSLLREVFTDDEAAEFSASIVQNHGIPGLVVSPKSDASKPSAKQVEELRAEIDDKVKGNKRGSTLVMSLPTEVSQFGFDPNKLMLPNLRDIVEERVCAVLGIPAAVVGFGSGLQSTKVGATMRELRRLAWVQCVTPMQTDLAEVATTQLLSDFVGQPRRFRIQFDRSTVSSFQEERNQEAERASRLLTSGIAMVNEAREMVGLEPDPTQDGVYLRPSNTLPAGPGVPDPEPVGGDPDGEEEEDLTEDDDAEEMASKALVTTYGDRACYVCRGIHDENSPHSRVDPLFWRAFERAERTNGASHNGGRA
jgi:HK97 family phage portal protein